MSAEAVRLWERLGRLPALKTPRGVRLFLRADADTSSKSGVQRGRSLGGERPLRRARGPGRAHGRGGGAGGTRSHGGRRAVIG